MNTPTPTQIALVAAGVVALFGYGTLIVAPAWASYGRVWEKCAAALLTVFMLATLLAIGAVIGFALVWSYDRFA